MADQKKKPASGKTEPAPKPRTSAPSGGVGAAARQRADSIGFTDYWYNFNLQGVNENSLAFVSNTVMNGDGKAGGDYESPHAAE